MPRSRRFDPERRTRIVVATLELIAEEGVAGTSRRKVAARADVPLGSMTTTSRAWTNRCGSPSSGSSTV